MNKMPRAWIVASNKPSSQPTAESTETKQVVARIDMSEEVAGRGLCPECKTPMKIARAGISRAWICAADRITLPLPNGYKENDQQESR